MKFYTFYPAFICYIKLQIVDTFSRKISIFLIIYRVSYKLLWNSNFSLRKVIIGHICYSKQFFHLHTTIIFSTSIIILNRRELYWSTIVFFVWITPFWSFCNDLLSKVELARVWMNYKDFDGSLLKSRVHWAKESPREVIIG